MASLVVWIDAEYKVASFHEEIGYEKKAFLLREEYLKYISELVECRFRLNNGIQHLYRKI